MTSLLTAGPQVLLRGTIGGACLRAHRGGRAGTPGFPWNHQRPWGPCLCHQFTQLATTGESLPPGILSCEIIKGHVVKFLLLAPDSILLNTLTCISRLLTLTHFTSNFFSLTLNSMIYSSIVLAASELLLIFAIFFPRRRGSDLRPGCMCGLEKRRKEGHIPPEGAWGQKEHPALTTRVTSI